MQDEKITAIVIGAGARGVAYANFMKKMDNKFDIVAVADVLRERCENIKNIYDLSDEDCYENWEEILSKPKMADVAVIATMDDTIGDVMSLLQVEAVGNLHQSHSFVRGD